MQPEQLFTSALQTKVAKTTHCVCYLIIYQKSPESLNINVVSCGSPNSFSSSGKGEKLKKGNSCYLQIKFNNTKKVYLRSVSPSAWTSLILLNHFRVQCLILHFNLPYRTNRNKYKISFF